MSNSVILVFSSSNQDTSWDFVKMNLQELSLEDIDIVTNICLDPSVQKKWREAMMQPMEHRKDWLKAMMSKGLHVVAVIGPRGGRNGLVEYLPIQYAPEPVIGTNTLFINCIWIVPPAWEKGYAKKLMEHAINEAQSSGGLSVLAYKGDKWFGYFQYMPSSFFERFGFEEVDQDGSRVLLHLDLGSKEIPSLVLPKTRSFKSNGRNLVEVLFNSQCPWSGWMADKIRRNLKKYEIDIKAINTDSRDVVLEYGLSRGVCVNGTPVLKRMGTVKEVESVVMGVISLTRRVKRST